jgi:hypothetical protein
MTKDKLQAELLEKVKEGVKPSDLKRPSQKQPKKPLSPPPMEISKSDEGYSSDHSDLGIPKAPPLPNSQIQALQAQINSLKKQLQVYQDFKIADLKIKEKYKQEIKDLQAKNQELNKTIANLQNQAKTTAETKEVGTQTEKSYNLKNYSCQICFTNRKAGIPSQFLRVKNFGGERNKKIWVCFLCRKQVVVIYDEEENWRDF